MTTIPPSTAERTRRGYVPMVAFASFGIYLGLLAPGVGGLSVKIQTLVGLDAAPAQLGLLTGVGAIFALITLPLAGRLSDRTTSRFGMRRPWILFGSLALVAALLGCGLAPNMPLLIVAWCAVQVCANAALAALSATVADQVPERRRGGVSGILGAAVPVSFLVGAIMLALLPNEVLRFVVPGLVGLIAAVIFVVNLKDRVRTEHTQTRFGWRTFVGSFYFNPRQHPEFGRAWLSKFLVMVGYSALSGYLTLYLGAVFGMSVDEQLAFNALAQLAGVSALVIFSVVGGYLSDRVGRRKPFVVGSGIVIAVGTVIAATAPYAGDAGLGVLLVAQVVIGIGAGGFFAVDQALCIALLPDPEDTAKDLGVLNSANALATSAGPLIAGVVIVPLGNLLTDGFGYSLWFVIAAVIAVIGAVLILPIRSVK